MTEPDTLGLLGTRIRQLREEREWSQEELARRCGRHFTYVGRVERGKQNITVEVLRDVAAALDVPIADLLVEEVHPLLAKWKVTAMDVIQAVNHGFRAQVDVKGKLAEWMLFKELNVLHGEGKIQAIEWLDADDKPDFVLKVGKRDVVVECKNVRSLVSNERQDAPIRVEMQKTRNARDGSNTRGYRNDHFDVLSACMFNRIGRWDFVHIAIDGLETRSEDPSCLKVMHRVPRKPEGRWCASILEAIKDRRR
jgi:transcriptional regulator with XRE-family HTH domain